MKRTAGKGMMQQLRNLPISLRILAVAAAALVVIALAAGVGAIAALVSGPGSDSSGGGRPQQAEEANHEQASKQGGASDRSDVAEYLSRVADIQNGSVEASLETNNDLLRYDELTTDDIKQMKASYAVLTDYASRAKGLDPPEKYRRQHEIFVRAIDELRDANGLAYQLIADPASATHADFDAYDEHISKATAYLKQSNEMLGRDLKTTAAAQKVTLG